MDSSELGIGLHSNIDYLIATPLPEEMAALVAAMPKATAKASDSLCAYYYWAQVADTNGVSKSIVAVLPSDMANIPMANLVHMAVQRWKPKHFVLIGIAGGIQKVNLGDVIVARYVFQWDAKRKEKDDKVESSLVPHDAGTWGVNCANLFLSQPERYLEWQTACTNSLTVIGGTVSTKYPELHIDNIATGDAVVDSKNTRERIISADRKLLGVETEAAGFVSAATAAVNKPKILIIRGISDLAAAKSELDVSSGGQWRKYAANNAVQALLAIIELSVNCSLEKDTSKQRILTKPDEELVNSVLFEAYHSKHIRYYLKRDIDDLLADYAPSHSLWLSGPSGVGKTTSAQKYMEDFHCGNWHQIDFGATGSCTLKELLLYIIDNLIDRYSLDDKVSHSKVVTAPALADRISQIINNSLSRLNRDIVLHFDEFAMSGRLLTDFLGHMVSILRKHKASNVKFIITTLFDPKNVLTPTQISQMERVYLRQMELWSIQEIRQLIVLIRNALHSLSVRLSDQDIETVASASKGSPRFVKRVFRNYLLRRNQNSQPISWVDSITMAQEDF